MSTATAGRSPSFRVAEADDLAWVVGQFAEAAQRAQAAGIDAVEIHAAHGYLLSTFLSAAYNHRDDEWGGPLAHRARLTCEVVAAVRAAVGPSFPILVRVNGHEYGVEGGLTAPETAEAAAQFEEAGADAIHVSANAHNAFADFTKGPLPSGIGQYRAFARTVRAAVGIPVVGVGRLLPEVAEEAIAGGDLDFAAMGRQLLADAELPAKLAAGRRESVRPCINCYVCVAQNFSDDTPRCAVNPALGAEELAELPPAGRLRRVVVVGGGPGGLETARIAARRGHLVTLLRSVRPPRRDGLVLPAHHAGQRPAGRLAGPRGGRRRGLGPAPDNGDGRAPAVAGPRRRRRGHRRPPGPALRARRRPAPRAHR